MTDHPNDTLAAELAALDAKATPGPWVNNGIEDGADHCRIRGTRLGFRFKVANAPFARSVVDEVTLLETAEAEANAALIVALRNNLPAIIAALSTRPSASVEEVERDAARYRWLRDQSCPPHNFYVSVPDEFNGVRYSSAEVDTYIDAAIAALRAGDAR